MNHKSAAPVPFTLDVLSEASAGLEGSSPEDVLRWALVNFPGTLTMATAFGAEGCVLLAMLAHLRDESGLAPPDVFNLDTGYQFPETLALRERLIEKYNIPVRLAASTETTQQMEERFGGPIYGTDRDRCCFERKVVPLGVAVQGFAAWITAIRRDQTPERAMQPIVGPESKFEGMVKINPLANWTKAQVWDYVEQNEVPTNVLHQQGYPSIGCAPCTRAVALGEDDRAGRWAGSDKRECGLHLAPDGVLARSGPQPVKLMF